MPYRISFKFSGGIRSEGVLDDSEASKRVANLGPFTSRVNLWGDEIYFELPADLGIKGERREVEVGTIAYWPDGNSLCIFFGPTPMSRDDQPVAYTAVKPLGKITAGLELLKRVSEGEKVEVNVVKL